MQGEAPMRQGLKPAALALAMLMMVPATASAEEEHPYHPPRYRVYYKRKVVVVRPPPPPKRHRRLVVVRPQEAEQDKTREHLLGIGLRMSGTGLDGGKLGLSDLENPGLIGFGLQLRSHVSPRWELEVSADYLTSTDVDIGFDQSTVPVMFSTLLHPFVGSAIDPYLLAGIGVHFTNLSYLDGLFEHHILELAGQLGVGLQINFGRHFSIHTDVRFLSVYKNLGTSAEVRSDCIKSSAGGTGYCNGLANMDPDDQFNIGVQFQAGATYYF